MSLVQAAFTEEGLSKLWNELVKDGEIGGSGGEPSNRKEEEEEGQTRRSPFTAFLEEWTWGQVCVYVGLARKGKGRGAVLVLSPDLRGKKDLPIWLYKSSESGDTSLESDDISLSLVTQV